MKILIVDDAADGLYMLETLLKGSGYEVVSARDGVEALDRLKEESVDMIISDTLMPKMDGFQLCRQCKQDERLKKIPFVFYTATYTDGKDEEFALNLGAEKYIVKPVEPEVFLKLLEDVIEEHRKGALVAPKKPMEEEDAYLAEHNRRLMQKLEDKVLDLEREITERKRVEERIQNLNNVLLAIRTVNHLILEETDRDRLLQKACDALIETQGYDAVWIGLLSDGEAFSIVKGSGFGEDVARFCEQVLAGDYPPCIRNALARKEKFLIVDKSRECGDCLSRKTITGKEAVVIRVEYAGKLFGLVVIARAPDVAVNDEEKELLEDVADDIAFALHDMEMEEARKRAEQALQESEEKYRSLTNDIRDVVFEIDHEGRWLFLSPVIQELLGYNPEELLGKPCTEILRPEDAGIIAAGFEKTGDEYDYESIFIHKNGDEIPTRWVGRPIRDEAGRLVSVKGTIRDNTAHKRLESQLRQAQKMEAIGTLAGGIAHDFNNILTPILGFTELTLSDLPAESKAHGYLSQVLKAGKRAADLVAQILAFSRQTEGERKPIHLAPIVREALKLLRSTLPTTIEIRRNIAPDTGAVLADPTQFHQVLMNLCTNAEHTMPEGGVLDVSLENVELDEKFCAAFEGLSPDSYVRLTVSDTGCGMDQRNLERIFDPFFTTRALGEGTGMGLSVVHGIVKNHGGDIIVHSEPGVGTTFHVFLPVVESMAEARSEPAEPVRGGTESLLFVDDEAMLVEIERQTLELLGYRVTTRANGVEALEAFRAQPDAFDLVITDQTMPQMTGADLAEELLRIRPELPIILCTGFSFAITPEKACAMGIHEFVMKPIVGEELGRIVRRVLDEASKKEKP